MDLQTAFCLVRVLRNYAAERFKEGRPSRRVLLSPLRTSAFAGGEKRAAAGIELCHGNGSFADPMPFGWSRCTPC